MEQQHSAMPRLPPRAPESHKGDFGTALIVGGSRGMAGAVALAGMAALRGGTGLVRLAVPSAILDTVAGFEPSYMTVALPSDEQGRIAPRAFDRLASLAEKAHYSLDQPSAYEQIAAEAEKATIVACGPGLGRSAELDRMVQRLYQELPKPMVFDADALNALAAEPDVLATPAGPRILTPHPGEFARLIGTKLEGDARNDAAMQLAARCHIIVVLKGHRTMITDGRYRAINSTGNPGMATGGSGDVLTGLITALACQQLAPFDAARLGVYLHGLAGDLAAAALGPVAMIAGDIVRYLPVALTKYFAQIADKPK